MEDRSNNSIVPADPRSDVVLLGPTQYAPHPPAEPQQPNIFRLVHSTLRGRYPIVIALGLVFTIAGGVAGYLAGRPMYRSEAIIRIHPRLPKILYNLEQDITTGPMFNSYVNSQVALVQNSRVINSAVNSDAWRAIGRTNLPEDAEEFRKSLRVNTTRETQELINVSFTDKDAVASKVGIDEVLRAYEEMFVTGGQPIDALRRSTLETIRRTANERINFLREEIRTVASEYGTDDLTQLHSMHMQALTDLWSRILGLRVAIAERAAPGGADGNGAPPAGGQLPADASPEQIAAVDPLMENYLNQRRQLDAGLASLKAQGFGMSHPAVQKNKSDLDSLNGIITEYATLWNATREIRPAPAIDGGGAIGAGQTVPQLQARLTSLMTEAERGKEDAVELGKKKMAIEAKQQEIDDQLVRLNEANKRLEEINVEAKVEQAIARIEIMRPDAIPSSPTVDPRKKYAVLGGGLGGSFVLGVALLIGLIDKRCRYSDEVNNEVDGKLLACLPVMARSTDQEGALAAVHSLHRVRAQMQIVSSEHRTIAVTSANAGDGKTSLCLSLGISFAGVGHRTLLIDLDLIGHGLSSRMRMCDGPGVLDALTAGSIEGFARASHAAGLFILPVGAGVDASPAKLRRGEIEALIRRAAASYDTVLIDTGPLLGSLEANFVCSSADAVLLVIGRGQSRALVRRAIQHIRDINARLLGVVFNRARDQDFRSSSVSASFRSVRTSRPSPATTGGPSRSVGIDPLADAVFVDAQNYADEINLDKKDATAPAA